MAGDMTLHLGVLVQPYRSSTRKVKALTTGDVAGFLESRYGIMQTYFDVHQKVVAGAIEKSVLGALEARIMGAPATLDPFGSGMSAIETDFKKFITSKEVERVGIPGTPTKAALNGVNHRLAHPYRKSNPRRPSFRDTGLYLASFKAWISS